MVSLCHVLFSQLLQKQLKEEVRIHEESQKFLQNQQEVTLILTSDYSIVCCGLVAVLVLVAVDLSLA